MGKIFVIGDIHGCLDKLKTIMNRINIDGENDTLVFIGDYIDRGPDPKGVVPDRKTQTLSLSVRAVHTPF